MKMVYVCKTLGLSTFFTTVQYVTVISLLKSLCKCSQITEDEFANAQYPITILQKVASPDHSTDLLLCAGHFDAVQVFADGKVCRLSTLYHISAIQSLLICTWLHTDLLHI